VISISHLTVRFGGLIALNDFSLQVPAGGLIGLIGPNGAGKTTVFNLITGVYKPTSGTILFNNQALSQLSSSAIARKGVARTFQNIRLFKGLSVLDNLLCACYRDNPFFSTILCLPGAFRRHKSLIKKAEDMLDFVGLLPYKNAVATSLSYGFQRKLEIARALMINPRLLLLDEPAAGMNPTEKDSLSHLVKKISQRDVAILLIEHDMKFVMELCQTITVLDYGEIICSGTADQVQSDPRVIEAYLGQDLSKDLEP